MSGSKVSAVLIILLTIVLEFVSTFFAGFILVKFWHWFLLPVFPNAPTFGLLGAIGLLFIANFFQLGTNIQLEKIKSKIDTNFELEKNKDSSEKRLEALIWVVAKVLFMFPLCLGIGWVWYICMNLN